MRITRGRYQDPNDFQCVTDPKKMEHAGKKIAFACCEANTCSRRDEDGQCLAGDLRNYRNFAPKDWHEATNVCAAEGKVLCGVDKPCSGSGCSYDFHYQWTGEECQAGDAGLPAACAADDSALTAKPTARPTPRPTSVLIYCPLSPSPTTTLESRKWCKKLYTFIRRNTHSYGYLRKFPVRGHRHELHRPDPIPHDHQQDGHRSPRRPDPGPHQSPQRSPAQRAPEDGGPEWGDVPRPILDHDLRRGEARLFAEQRPVVRAGAPLRQIIAVVDGP